jgi:hypothetical protein
MLKAELAMAHRILGEDKQTQTELENCDQTIQELKRLYQHFQIDFS